MKEVQPVFKVVQLTEVEVTDVSKAVELLSKGSSIRSTESTSMNSNSSRSHAVFTISLISSDMADGSTVTRKINLVDLAGSENPNRTQAVGNRFTEGVGINMGLSTLSRVITALSKKAPYIPYRDSTLTKVLKECLQSHCYITMVSCISPNVLDMQETISTLRFSNSAKHLRTKPLPANLLNSCRTSVAKKKTHAQRIPATPHQGNNTIHTVTPSKYLQSGFKRTLNSTIGTPGKRAKGETNRNDINATPRIMINRPVTSTTSKFRRHDDDLCDISGVSMIEPPEDSSENATSSIPTTLTNTMPADVSQFFSPLMRAVKETVKENMKEEFNKMFKELKADLTSSKITSKTPVKMAKSRATSSPNRLLARTRNSPLDMSEDSDLANTTIVVNEMASSMGEDIISGAGVTLPLKEKPNPILRAVVNSASPELSRAAHPLPVYDSPPSTQVRQSTSSPTIEEMERTLGINPDSPGAIMFTAPTITVNTNKPKRSTRRTTMMASELNQTLKEIQNTNHGRRRSVRVAAQGRYYGSPGKEEENRHLLMEQDNWKKVDPRKQAQHNNRILDFLNTGNAKVLAVIA